MSTDGLQRRLGWLRAAPALALATPVGVAMLRRRCVATLGLLVIGGPARSVDHRDVEIVAPAPWADKRPSQLLAELADHPRRLVVFPEKPPADWVRETDVDGLLAVLDSTAPSGSMSYLPCPTWPRMPSTTGRLARFFLAAFANGYLGSHPDLEFEPEDSLRGRVALLRRAHLSGPDVARCRAIGRDIEALKSGFAQLAGFHTFSNVRDCRIAYEFRVHAPAPGAGWRARVPQPDADGIVLLIELTDDDAGEANNLLSRQIAGPPARIGRLRVTWVMSEGRAVAPVSERIRGILEKHGMTTPGAPPPRR